MARIPIYNQQVTPSGSPGVARISAGGEGRGLQAIGQGLGALADSIERKEQVAFDIEKEKAQNRDEMWFFTSSSKFDAGQRKFLIDSQQTAEPGAAGFADTFLKGFDETAEGALKNAPSEMAKQRMAAHIARSREKFAGDAQLWEAGERGRHQGQQFDEGLEIDASLLHADPSGFADAMGKAGLTVKGLALPPAEKAKLLDLAKAKLASATLKGWIDQNPEATTKILKDWTTSAEGRDNIVTVKLNGKETQVPIGLLDYKQQQMMLDYAETKTKQASAQKFAGVLIDSASAVVAAAPLMPGDMVDLPQAKANGIATAQNALGRSLTPEERLQLEQRVEAAAADRERDIKRSREASVAWAFDALDKNGGDFQALVRDNPALATGLTTEQKARVNDYAGKVATGVTRPTDWQAYNALVADPAVLKATNLDAIRDKFSAGEFAQLKKAQQEILTSTGAEQNLVTTHSLVKGMLEEAGFKKDEKKQAKFFSLLQQAVDQELMATGKKSIPQTRVKELASDLLVKEITSRGVLWDSKDEGFEITVPPVERVKIEAALISQGLPVTDYNVLQAYRNKLRQKTNLKPAPTQPSAADQIPR